jgi:putative PIN family toxin of toxin-antitoxin system
MKVIIDTNVFLSYILAPAAQGIVSVVVTACLALNEIDLLIPPEQLTEFSTKAATKRYFRSRIPQNAIDHFVAQLKLLSEMLPPVEEIASYSRDPKDDYLVAYGIVNEAEYLITGDHDLRVLERAGALQIVSPSQFLKILRRQTFLP